MNSKTPNPVFLLTAAALWLTGAAAVQELRFASPLQSLTIPDPELLEKIPEPTVDGKPPSTQGAMATPRRRFLERFKTGLKAEQTAREQLALGIASADSVEVDASGKNWVGSTKSAEEQRRLKEEAFIEQAHDAAVASFESSQKKKSAAQNTNKYQFVGLVDRSNKEKPISWHARPKPSDAKWSVRLVHVNKDAIVKDLFDRGKIDIFAKYRNTGKMNIENEGEENEKVTNIPIVTTKYEARERSWKNLYNFSPKHFFTDSAGAYWRERRLRSGMYTDGESVYESSYRYRDGRNGMHKVGSLQQFLASSAVDSKDKESILKKLKEASPDVVLEL